MVISTIIMVGILTLSGCYGTYYISDAEYSDLRESHASVTYYDNQIYWGWNSGYYYYYGMPHYYPWYYYYNACPPSHYAHTTHVVITRPVNKPTHRPNRPNTHRTNIRTKSNTNVKPVLYIPVSTNPNKNNVKTNTRVKVTPNRNTKVKTNRNNKNTTRTKVNHRKPK